MNFYKNIIITFIFFEKTEMPIRVSEQQNIKLIVIKIVYNVHVNLHKVLTSTSMPGIRNIFSGGTSRGEYRQNSRSPLYHFTVYKTSCSKSYKHFISTLEPRSTDSGTAKWTFLKHSVPDKVKFNLQLQINYQVTTQW